MFRQHNGRSCNGRDVRYTGVPPLVLGDVGAHGAVVPPWATSISTSITIPSLPEGDRVNGQPPIHTIALKDP